MAKTFLHSMFIDFNSFFASVEQVCLLPPSARPAVVVVPLMAETTCCIAASRQAKPYGIKTGTPVHEARRLCPDLEVIEARPELLRALPQADEQGHRGMRVSPNVESIDEVHCPLWGEWMEIDAAKRLGSVHQGSDCLENQPLC